MRYIILIMSMLLLSSCFAKISCIPMKEQLNNSQYKVGDIITPNKGYYSGCHFKVQELSPRCNILFYYGESEDCPQMKTFGVDEQ